MNVRIDQLVKTLLRKETLAECSLQELENFAASNPYLGAAQLLLTKKLQQEDPARFDAQLQKTYLFFHNPLWVQRLLSENGEALITVPAKEPAPTAVIPPEIPEKTEPTIVNPALETDLTPVINPLSNTEPAESTPEELPAQEEPTEATVLPVAETTDEKVTAEAENTATNPATELTTEPVVTSTQAETAFQPGMPAAAEDPLVFEPYYTVDYFASQGIKMREEEKPKDKFSQQLRSFTGWLRTLKKLPAMEIEKAPVTAGEHKAEQLAASSLQNPEIVTEAMAEVWILQGNKAKALEVYDKLSLLEPAKSTYFAAKIEALKKL